MDYRHDLATIWANYELETQKKVFLKVIIKEDIKPEITQYLESNGISEDIVYPD